MPSPSVALLRTQTDERLTALAAAGHERAFEAIVERYRRPLLRHCRRYLPEARAEDALQQALVSAWTALRRGDDVRELRPWLYRIVHNASLNALRAAGYDYEQLHDTLHGSGGPAELAERSAVVRQTLAGLAALPERQREALLRIAVEGRSQDEVADALGLSHGAVRQLVHRARTTLRAAATAVMPLPFAGWLASAGAARGDVVARVGELIAGAGGSATLAKAGAVAVLAGGAVGGPVVVDRLDDRPGARPAAAAAASPAHTERERSAAPVATPARDDDGGERRGHRGGDDVDRSVPGAGGEAEDRSGRREGESDDRSGPSDDGPRDDRSGSSDDDSRDDRSGSSGSGSSDSGSGSSGSGSVEAPEPEIEVESEPEHSGSGSSGAGELEPSDDSSRSGSGESDD